MNVPGEIDHDRTTVQNTQLKIKISLVVWKERVQGVEDARGGILFWRDDEMGLLVDWEKGVGMESSLSGALGEIPTGDPFVRATLHCLGGCGVAISRDQVVALIIGIRITITKAFHTT